MFLLRMRLIGMVHNSVVAGLDGKTRVMLA